MRSTDPIPPPVPRTDVLGTLQRELWLAQDTGETAYAQQLERRIADLSADSTPTAPRRETTAAAPPRRETTSRKPNRSHS